MASNPIPQPQPDPEPVVSTGPVTCPSCGSEYDPASHELVLDTGLPVTIREQETTMAALRDELTVISRERDALKERVKIYIDGHSAESKRPVRDFIVGER